MFLVSVISIGLYIHLSADFFSFYFSNTPVLIIILEQCVSVFTLTLPLLNMTARRVGQLPVFIAGYANLPVTRKTSTSLAQLGTNAINQALQAARSFYVW